MADFAAVLPAAGSSTRFGAGSASEKKIFADLDGRPVWLASVDAFRSRSDVGEIVLAIAPGDRGLFEDRHGAELSSRGVRLVEGGRERVDSVRNALAAIAGGFAYVAVHDAARPLIGSAEIDAVFDAARRHGAAALGRPVADTLKRVRTSAAPDGGNLIVETVDRSGLWAIQTPQAFRRDWLEEGFAVAASGDFGSITDDTRLMEILGRPCAMVPGAAWNLKITTRDDLTLARAIVAAWRSGAAD